MLVRINTQRTGIESKNRDGMCNVCAFEAFNCQVQYGSNVIRLYAMLCLDKEAYYGTTILPFSHIAAETE